jgi:hypothetical protein
MKFCTWCGKILDSNDPSFFSHGSCPECVRFYGDSPKRTSTKEFIESFSFPVLSVNANVMVFDANTPAQKLLGKGIEEITGRLGGEVIECLQSQLPGGCGQTICCIGCAIRQAVTMTHKTGIQFIDVNAFQVISTRDGPKRIQFKISTVRRSSSVLLKIVPVVEATSVQSNHMPS